jgi:menaquinone-dependent protoporphyrinogen oxidase
MNGKVLVAYATRYGSTGEVAEAIGVRLQEQGLVTEVARVQELSSVEDCEAVVFGTPFYMGSMLKEARAFLDRRREELGRLPVALFALGPTSADDDLEEAGKQLDEALEKLPWLHPTTAEMFVGKFDPAKLRFADKLVTALPASPLHGLAAHDDRDWAAIDAWADGVAAGLSGAATGASEVELGR